MIRFKTSLLLSPAASNLRIRDWPAHRFLPFNSSGRQEKATNRQLLIKHIPRDRENQEKIIENRHCVRFWEAAWQA